MLTVPSAQYQNTAPYLLAFAGRIAALDTLGSGCTARGIRVNGFSCEQYIVLRRKQILHDSKCSSHETIQLQEAKLTNRPSFCSEIHPFFVLRPNLPGALPSQLLAQQG